MTDAQRAMDQWFAALNEQEAGRRVRLVEAAWTPEGRWVDPPFEGSGHTSISGMIDAIYEQYPDHRFRQAGTPDAHHDSVRVRWQLVDPEGNIALQGTDFGILAEDGRLARVTGFFEQPVG